MRRDLGRTTRPARGREVSPQGRGRGLRAVLTYHSIDDSGSPISVAREAFARHVRWLASGRVRVLPVEELLDSGEGEDAVAITFDDGFENVASEAAPLLVEHGLAATVFVVTDHVGGTNAWGGHAEPGVPTLRLLGWAGLERLTASGLAIGAHTRRHPDLTRLGVAALEDEIHGGADHLRAQLGVPPRSFAYPYGRANPAVVRSVSARFRAACTTDLRLVSAADDPWRLPRLDMYYFQRPGQIDAWGTAPFMRRLQFKRGVRRLRSLLSDGRFPPTLTPQEAMES